VEVAWDRELTRRLDEILSGKAIGESSNQVFSKLREKYSGSQELLEKKAN